MRLYEEMQQADLRGDMYTLTALLTACERVGKWRLALTLLADYEAAGVASNLQHHNCLLSTFSRTAQWDMVLACRQLPGLSMAPRQAGTAQHSTACLLQRMYSFPWGACWAG